MMKWPTNKARCALLLALVFLLAQFHLCADLSQSHPCAFCQTVAAAIATDAPILGIAPAAARLEIASEQIEIATAVAPSISPRAPPTSSRAL